MIKIVFATPVPEERRKPFTDLKDTDIRFIDRTNLDPEDLKDAEVILGNVPRELVDECPNLKWLQLDSAGANTYKDIRSDILLTNASGAYGEAISEHMLGCVLMVMKNLARYMDIQKAHDFINLGSVNTIANTKVLSVGMGDIGSAFAEKMSLLGAEVYGVRRNVHDKPDYLKGLYTMDQMDEILPECDVVALSLPETPETIGMFNEERLMKMKKGAMILNVGRGSAIDTDALLRVMQKEHLSAACLDVTDPEPLPKNHPLWNTKHVYLTPHISGRFNASVTFDKVLNIFHDNLIRYMEGKPLNNMVDRTLGY